MKACGIIVEYNPFHNGHLYHAKIAREKSQAEVVIAVMSGNFLQRGEPAMLDKWTRAEEALENGVDLVVELPFAYAVQSADYFAKGGIKLLQALACEAVCFGTDYKNEIDYAAFGQFTVENQQAIDEAYQKIKNNGMSYPQQMTQVFRELYSEIILDFSSPNHILAMGYAKENALFPNPMKLLPIHRKDSQYHDKKLGETIASATAIRKTVLQEKRVPEKVIPKKTCEDLQQIPLVSWENYWNLLKYQILTSSVEELRGIYQMSEGIEYRLKEKIQEALTFQDFVEKVKTKRYTWTRLQRLFTYLLLNVTREQIEEVWNASYLRVLGFNHAGQRYLKERKADFTLPTVTNLSQKQPLHLDVKAGQIYQLGNQKIQLQDAGRYPQICS